MITLKLQNNYVNSFLTVAAMCSLLASFASPVMAASQTSPTPTVTEIKALQHDLNADLGHIGMPILAEDGKMGPQTRRALCAERYFTGRTASLANPTSSEIKQLVAEDRLSSPLQGFIINKTCQVLGVSETVIVKMVPVSTANTAAGRVTPNGDTRVSYARFGWHNSSKYPSESGNGNMYKPLYFASDGSYAIHGSREMNASVTTAQSHGCVRTIPADQEILAKYAGMPTTAKIDQVVAVKHIPIHVR